MAVNLASAFSKEVDERFSRASQTAIALNNRFKFQGVRTVNVYSVPIVPLNDYNRNGTGSGTNGTRGSGSGTVNNGGMEKGSTGVRR